MNLNVVHAILVAANRHPHGSLKIANPKLEPQVREMAEAGLITAALRDGKKGSLTAVKSITGAGRQFLRVFHPHDFSQPIKETKSASGVIPFVKPRLASH